MNPRAWKYSTNQHARHGRAAQFDEASVLAAISFANWDVICVAAINLPRLHLRERGGETAVTSRGDAAMRGNQPCLRHIDLMVILTIQFMPTPGLNARWHRST
jgi:hypothetical protein